MERRTFLRNSLLTAGGVLLGGTAVFRFLKYSKPEGDTRPVTIEKVCQGNGKNVLVLMSAGTRQGNTDRLTDAYIKGLYEKGHTVTKCIWAVCVWPDAGDAGLANVMGTTVPYKTTCNNFIRFLPHVIRS